ncbi:unnamed protein product [Parnassius mnemosyne]|uniref:Transposable element Tc3 transposase n=1 Tax=Parnassius mnemosyne TaxID=213953 RepID=A0AAV1KQH5_9NEOP
MTHVFSFVELKKEREYPKAHHIVFYKDPKCIRFTYNEFKILPRDYPERISFCRTMLQRHNENPQFIQKILWSDESTFKKDGYINLNNFHEWHVANLHLMRENRFQYRFKVNLWTGILNGKIVRAFELLDILNGTNYLHFLRENLPTLLEDVPLTDRRHMWYQQDGYPAHYAVQVRDFLDQEYPGRWIERSGTISWPARSPDLNPLDFLNWGVLEEKVYSKPIDSVAELRERISQAAEDINYRGYARLITRSFLIRSRACIEADGKQFEHLL